MLPQLTLSSWAQLILLSQLSEYCDHRWAAKPPPACCFLRTGTMVMTVPWSCTLGMPPSPGGPGLCPRGPHGLRCARVCGQQW